MSEILIKCKDCGKTFSFTDNEQDFYKKHELNSPKRCKECRKKRKQEVK